MKNIVAVAGEIVDADAIEIGSLYEKARGSLVDSVRWQIECGQRLVAKKATMAHGAWLPWLAHNEAVLGFETPRTAQMLMKAANKANTKSTSHFTPEDAVKISRETWGNAGPHVSNNSGNNEWYTPEVYIFAARQTMGGIDLDPASSEIANSIVGAERFFSIDDDGLNQKWAGRVWLNPPYAQPLVTQFAEAVAEKYVLDEIEQACVLVNNATETGWFRSMALVSDAICFLENRVKFLDETLEPVRTPLQGQAVIYMGPDKAAFLDNFGGLGFVVVRI